MTTQEEVLHKIIRSTKFCGYKFNRHVAIGDYIVDFVCEKKKIIIDIFYGNYNTKEEEENDKIRLEYFKSKGYKVLRFMDKEVEYNIDGVYWNILDAFGLVSEEKTINLVELKNINQDN